MKERQESFRFTKKKIIFFITILITFISTISFTANTPIDMPTWREKDYQLQKLALEEFARTEVEGDIGGLQGFAVTHKHIVFSSLSTSSNSYIYFMDKETKILDTSLTITIPCNSVQTNSKYGHLNDMTYNPDTGEILIPYTDADDNLKAKVAIIKYTNKITGTVSSNIEVVSQPTKLNGDILNAGSISYNPKYGYIFQKYNTICIAQRNGSTFTTIAEFSIGESDDDRIYWNMTEQGLFTNGDYLYECRWEAGEDMQSTVHQVNYYDSTEQGSAVILMYKIKEDLSGLTYLKTLYIPGTKINDFFSDKTNRIAELETGCFDKETGELYLGYNFTRVSGETKKTKYFYKVKTGLQTIDGKQVDFNEYAYPKTQTSITGQDMIVSSNLVRYYNANNILNSSSKIKDLSSLVNTSNTGKDGLLNGFSPTSLIYTANGYMSLDGVDDWINIGEISGIYDKVTLETQVSINSTTSTTSYLISNAELGGYILYIKNGILGFQAHIDGSYQKVELNETLSTNKVYNISAVFNGSSLALYVDGNLKKTTTLSGTKTVVAPSNNTVMAIGTNPAGSIGSSNFANINVYTARIYSSALTQDQIKQNMNADRITPHGLSVDSKNLTLTINFSQAVNNISGNDITIQNGTISSITKISDYKYIINVTNFVSESTLNILTKNTITDIAGNTITTGTAKIIINVPKATKPIVTAYNKIYDGLSHTVTVSGGSEGTIQYSTDKQTWSSDAPTYKDYTNGAKTIYVKVAGDSTHCDSDIVASSITITKRSITVTANDKKIIYGDNIPLLDWTIGETGISGEIGKATGTLKTSATSSSTSGTYDIINNTVALLNNENFKSDNYIMSFEKGTLTINKYNLSNASLNIANETYNGSTKTPAPTVKMGTTVISSSEYDVSYSNNTNAGTAGFIVTAKSTSSNFTGSKSGTFIIEKAHIAVPSSPASKTYNGTEQQSGITLPTNTSIVTESSTTSATNAGSYNVLLKLNDISNYQWDDGTTANKTVSWIINKYNLNNATISKIPAQNYNENGNIPIPTLTVSFPNESVTTLINNTDFTCSYINNNQPTDNAKIIVTAKDNSNYIGYREITFTINPRIIFNSNGGLGTMNNQFVSYNANTTLSQNTYTKTGYAFGGWALSKENANTGIIDFKNHETIVLTSNITLYAIWIPSSYKVTEYTVDDNNISNVDPETTISEFKEHIILDSTGSVRIFDKNEAEITDNNSIICTGMTIKIFLADNTINLAIIVTGDVDGNGSVNIQDLMCINKHRLQKNNLESIYLKAGDLNKDNSVNIIDLFLLNKFRLGIIAL